MAVWNLRKEGVICLRVVYNPLFIYARLQTRKRSEVPIYLPVQNGGSKIFLFRLVRHDFVQNVKITNRDIFKGGNSRTRVLSRQVNCPDIWVNCPLITSPPFWCTCWGTRREFLNYQEFGQKYFPRIAIQILLNQK